MWGGSNKAKSCENNQGKSSKNTMFLTACLLICLQRSSEGGQGGVVVVDELTEEVLDKIDLVRDVSKSFQIAIRGEEREVSPKNINDWARVDCVGCGISQRKVGGDRR